ncbi:Double-strand break repair protein mus-23 [Bacidia gigantensis]|uniref:Double-strand break repair protein mus-23 n=1 Tax=Bacidia gigantensis TaxID=2732470 RepID=UPI001D048030|nr:Double-strand break repair protein mus-23 [Bacidia gigantensis]KAG8527726.1 Double-strand break repair protein mus-23 [Bacidia gigantensis]
MPGLTAADTIRVLVATDNHVGYAERDAIRGEDSWRSFHEIMCLAKARDVDMVLLAGDLFHDNKPSRKSMFNVMRSLRMNCYGDKPCELEMLSDNSEVFQGAFNYVNYEDPDINVAIPVFSIHGNHDDPSGEGHLAALDILQTAGLLNYYGRTPESDNVQIKPVLLQKGRTKLALYGMSNIRDERMFRTFRDGKVKFFQPGTQKQDWFNLMSVHQNHHAYTDTGYLPENFLPDFMDLVVWGHEHECLIDPTYNPETNFHVMQPGSSVATSLMPGEAVPKKVAILTVTGKEFKSEPIRLKSVRPFVMKEIVLSEEKEAMKLAKKANNRTELTRFLEGIVNVMIDEANQEWEDAQDSGERDDEHEPPLPLIRLRVEYSAPEGGNFDCENPQRFSNRFVNKVANTSDVVQFHRRKAGGRKKATANGEAELPEDNLLESSALDSVKIEKLVKEFLAAQSLTILPQNLFGDAVSQFVDKDDKHAMEQFLVENLSKQVELLLQMDHVDEDALLDAMEQGKSHLEELFAKGLATKPKRAKWKPRPDDWDSDLNGDWHDNPMSLNRSDHEAEMDSDVTLPKVAPKTRGRQAAAPKKAAPAKKAPAKNSRSKKQVVESDEDDEEDVVMFDGSGNDEDESESQLFIPEPAPKRGGRKAAAAPAKKAAAKAPARMPARAAKSQPGRQSQLSFTQAMKSQTQVKAEISGDEISDDDEAFEPPVTARSTRSGR